VSLSAIPKPLRQRILERDRGRCCYCGLTQVGQGGVFHVNHIIPRSAGGLTEEANLALQCPHCSLHKANKLTGIDQTTGQKEPLFHPVRDIWNQHFLLLETGECIGRTPIGRATVDALMMNSDLPRIARVLQIGIGLIRVSAS
jgi:hypothetical protein